MYIKVGLWVGASILSAILYRAGGVSGYNTKFRDLGVPSVATGLLVWLMLKSFSVGLLVALFLHFGLLFGSLTTYWKRKGTDAHWYNWLLTGLGYSLSAIPIAWVSGHWVGFAIRCVLLTALTVLWSEKIGDVVWEEGGRGFLITATILLLLI